MKMQGRPFCQEATMCNLKVILFISGTGSDEKQYKPDQDATQWWSRRDSLARAVSSFLFGAPAQDGRRRELVFVFDEDLARYHMTVDSKYSVTDCDDEFFPSEKNLITLWREAAGKINGDCFSATVQDGPIRCEIRGKKQSAKTKKSETISKRDLLEMIQKQCSLEFLREHGLNCSSKVALKKANRKHLLSVWHLWHESTTKSTADKSSELETILRDLVQNNNSCQKVAATLHESGEELPVWNHIPAKSERNNLEVLFFLGAVRDMSKEENLCLSKVCKNSGVPFVNVRLGRVPEFTSKIIQVVAFHQSSGVLGPATLKLLQSNEKATNPKKRTFGEMENSERASPLVHIVLLTSLKSSELTDDLESRCKTAWSIVRCTVVSLWRSRLAGNKHKPEHLRMGMTLCFLDGLCLRLTRETLVQVMADQHQAAPSEYQILHCLKQMLVDGKAVKAKQEFASIISRLKNANRNACLAIHMGNGDDAKRTIDLGKSFYSQKIKSEDPYSLLVSIQIGANKEQFSKLRSKLKKACRSEEIDCVKSSLIRQPCLDLEATTITMIQHFCYQNKLFDALRRNGMKEQR